MERLRPWWIAARPEQALLVPLCVEIGAACAHFDAQPAAGFSAHLLIDAAALAAGLGVNLIEHVWDLPAAPPADPTTPVPEDDLPLPARDAAMAAAGCLLGAALLAGALAPLSGASALGFGALAVLLGVWRRAPAVGADALGYGLGDLATIAALGPLAVLAGFASQAGVGTWGAVYAGLPVGLAAATALYGRHFTRQAVDADLQRMTPVVAYGEDRARLGWLVLPLLAVATIVVLRSRGEYPGSAWIAAVPLAALIAGAAWRLRRTADDHDDRAWEALALKGVVATLLAIMWTLWFGAST
jgi:1,4-dihydroxy-2-naphthoate octaprenyltransferase